MPAEERREMVFQAAERLFAESGYEKVRMIDIANATGMAKKTLYVLFNDKQELLRELVASSFVWSDVSFDSKKADPVEELSARVRDVIAHVLSERHINLCRLAISESIGIEDLAITFHEMGLVRSRNALIATIDKIPAGRRQYDIPSDLIAGMLYGATCGHRLMTALLTGELPSLREAEAAGNLVIGQMFKPLGALNSCRSEDENPSDSFAGSCRDQAG
ncbi:TetR/AcrR family transcriptional regulator [Martelella soudanensis]|nr:TetR/AcrR family transcriptional regulator [Martelella sp. NC18]